MKLKHGATIHDIVRKSENSFEVDGARVEAVAQPAGTSRFHGVVNGRRGPVFVSREGDRVFAQVGGRAYNLTVMSRVRVNASADAVLMGGLEAPMPGRVTRVAVAVGDMVKRGQELIVVEAMKMENALVAPIDGVVKRLAVKVGDMVAPGPALVVIDAVTDPVLDAVAKVVK